MLTQQRISEIVKHEVHFNTSQSGGKGGQNVNKVETKVEIVFNVAGSALLHENEKQLIQEKYKGITKEGEIKLNSSRHRTQLQNKKEVLLKFSELLKSFFVKKKRRLSTRPTLSSKLKKEKNKKALKEKKQNRKKIIH